MRLAPLLVTTALMALAPACDSGDPAADPTPADPTPTDPTPTDPTPTDPVDVPDVPEEPTEPALEYPPGPYGGEYLDIVKDLGFYDPWLGTTTHLSDFLGDESTKVILISSGAGWCTACQYEAWDLVDTYEKYHADGLEVLYTLYEDTKGKALWRDSADATEIDADFTFMNEWTTSLGNWIDLETRTANYPVFVDVGFTLGEYYDKNATPLTLIVRTSDMRILYRQIGYAKGAVDTIVKGVLFAHP